MVVHIRLDPFMDGRNYVHLGSFMVDQVFIWIYSWLLTCLFGYVYGRSHVRVDPVNRHSHVRLDPFKCIHKVIHVFGFIPCCSHVCSWRKPVKHNLSSQITEEWPRIILCSWTSYKCQKQIWSQSDQYSERNMYPPLKRNHMTRNPKWPRFISSPDTNLGRICFIQQLPLTRVCLQLPITHVCLTSRYLLNWV